MSNATVWKFEIPMEDVARISMPIGAKVLHVAVQGAKPTMWALVDPKKPLEPRLFRVAGTGHPINAEQIGGFVGTVHLFDGSVVLHIFEAKVPSSAIGT